MATDECGCVFGDGTWESPLMSCQEPVGHRGEHRGRSLDGRWCRARWSQAKQATDEREAESIAQSFHETYERLAPGYGYKTREASAVPWAVVPEQNKRLMVDVVDEMLSENVISSKACLEAAEQRVCKLEAELAELEEDRTDQSNACAEEYRLRVAAEVKLATAVEAFQTILGAESECGRYSGPQHLAEVAIDRTVLFLRTHGFLSDEKLAELERRGSIGTGARQALSEIEQGDAK